MSAATSSVWDDLDGQLVLPDDRGYDEARQVWNAMVDRRPRMIVRCASVADMVAAVRNARELDLEIGGCVWCGAAATHLREKCQGLRPLLLAHVAANISFYRAR